MSSVGFIRSQNGDLPETMQALMRINPQLDVLFLKLYFFVFQHFKVMEQVQEGQQQLHKRVTALAHNFGNNSSTAFRSHELQRSIRWLRSECPLLQATQERIKHDQTLEHSMLQHIA